MSVFAVIVIFLAQFIIGWVWYSKYMFGGLYMSLNQSKVDATNVKTAFIKQAITMLVRAILIYFIVSEVFFLLPSSFFSIVIAILILVVLVNYESTIWSSESIKGFLLHAGQDVLSMATSFLIALFFYQL